MTIASEKTTDGARRSARAGVAAHDAVVADANAAKKTKRQQQQQHRNNSNNNNNTNTNTNTNTNNKRTTTNNNDDAAARGGRPHSLLQGAHLDVSAAPVVVLPRFGLGARAVRAHERLEDRSLEPLEEAPGGRRRPRGETRETRWNETRRDENELTVNAFTVHLIHRDDDGEPSRRTERRGRARPSRSGGFDLMHTRDAHHRIRRDDDAVFPRAAGIRCHTSARHSPSRSSARRAPRGSFRRDVSSFLRFPRVRRFVLPGLARP